MKINTNKSYCVNKKGMTLIEISLVVALLLSLIAILFIGITAYKRGADRSKCVLNISAVQKAVRSHQNMFELEATDSLIAADTLWPAAGDGYFPAELECPTNSPVAGVYTTDTTVPAVSDVYMVCSLAGGATQHAPLDITGW